MFEKVIIWGHKLHTHTHSYIHYGFYKAFKHLNYDVYWLNENDMNNDKFKNFNFDNCLFITEGQVDKNIPMNSGCLKPIKIIIPKNCMLNPKYPAAVVAGNVETSQHLVNALLSALNVMSSSQGTMNNLTFGNKK